MPSKKPINKKQVVPRKKTAATKIEDAIKSATVKKKSVSKMSASLYDIKGKEIGVVDLAKEIFGVKVNKVLIAQAIRIYLANQRRGTASTKTRGEVTGSTRKIYKQKGTGRARHGGMRAPIFVHGGIAHGPRPKDYSLSFPKKMKRRALFSALSEKLKNNEIKIIEGLGKIDPKTKSMVTVINNLDLNVKNKKILLILPSVQDSVTRASRNIKGVMLAQVHMLNVFEVLNNKMLLFMSEAIPKLEQTYVK